MRKVDDGKKEKKKEKKIMSFLVATNVIASRPPERRPLERRTLVPIYSLLGFQPLPPLTKGIIFHRNLMFQTHFYRKSGWFSKINIIPL